MALTTKQKVIALIQQKQRWPLLVAGLRADDFLHAVVIPSTIAESELGVLPEINGYKYPKWLMSVLIKAREGKAITLCINGIDELPCEQQAKFYGILQYKSLNGFKLPAQTQIIVTAQNLTKVAPQIKSMCLLVK